ncbi:helix-turn-helix transcriptional regulator [Flaviflagellibacter deserti]|uniref:Helix-turn-helix transcriptional regulator n=1 Tax=Flaviflagellibacter deserti TaxID=2267266 RepID=A0ABV9YXV5_9HYPH
MRRADRLFQIVQILRRENRPVTATAIAAELETSQRSVYRDIAALVGQRVPIRGEAGIGYVLEGGFDMPPLMLTVEEIEALALGAQWVMGHADPALAHAANDALAKIAHVLPEEMRTLISDAGARAPPAWVMAPDGLDVGMLRAWIRAGRKVAIGYRDEAGAETARTIWPFLLGYWEATRIVVGWCELRRDFRSFRLDRIGQADFLDERFPERPAVLRRRWQAIRDAADHSYTRS